MGALIDIEVILSGSVSLSGWLLLALPFWSVRPKSEIIVPRWLAGLGSRFEDFSKDFLVVFLSRNGSGILGIGGDKCGRVWIRLDRVVDGGWKCKGIV